MAQSSAAAEKPPFQGKLLRDVPVPTSDLWRDDEFGMALLGEYQERVKKDYDSNPALRVLKVVNHVVHGSNPFAVVLADMIARPQARVATPVDLQAILDSGGRTADPLNLRGFYKDCGLVLRSVREPNSYLAGRLNEQVGLKTQLPVLVFLSGLKLVKDTQCPYGLSFAFTGETVVFTAPILNEKSGHFDSRDVDRSTGLPTKLGGTDSYFYASEEGLTRLYLGRGGALDSIWDELANSQPDGRIVLVENTVPTEQVPDYLARLDKATELLE